MFHSRRCSYIRTDDPSTKTGVHCELEHRGLRSLRAVWFFFFFFTRRPRQKFPLPANLHRHSRHTHFQQDETSSLLDRRRHESRQTYRSYQFMLHLGTSTKLIISSLSAPTKIEELTAGSDEKNTTQPRRDVCFFFSSDPAVSSSIFVGAEREEMIRNDPNKSEFTIHKAVSRHLDKNRAKHRRTVFSMNKAQESKQRSTN